MAWNGSGTYTRTNSENSGATTWADDATAGTKITAANHDTHDEDLATAINACLTKNNETKPTANFVPNADDSYSLGSATVGWTNQFLTGGAVFDERADHATTPTAGRGEFWVKSDVPNIPMYTSDADVDYPLIGGVVGTLQASTSGTTVDFTSIPSWATQVVVSFVGVSTDGTEALLIRIGDAGGIENSSYLGSSSSIIGATASSAAYTTGFGIKSLLAADIIHGSVTLTLEDPATFRWVASGVLSNSATAGTILTSGKKALSAALDRVTITTTGTPDDFDAGEINIRYS